MEFIYNGVTKLYDASFNKSTSDLSSDFLILVLILRIKAQRRSSRDWTTDSVLKYDACFGYYIVIADLGRKSGSKSNATEKQILSRRDQHCSFSVSESNRSS